MSSDPFSDTNRDAGLSLQSQLTAFVLTPRISDKSAGVFIFKADRKQAKTAVRYEAGRSRSSGMLKRLLIQSYATP